MAAVIDLVYERDAVNVSRLHEELAAALGADFLGVSEGPAGRLRVHVRGGTEEGHRAAIDGIVAAHDAGVLSARQVVEAEGVSAALELGALVAARIEWHVANPVTGANAVEVLGRIQGEWVRFLRMLRREL